MNQSNRALRDEEAMQTSRGKINKGGDVRNFSIELEQQKALLELKELHLEMLRILIHIKQAAAIIKEQM